MSLRKTLGLGALRWPKQTTPRGWHKRKAESTGGERKKFPKIDLYSFGGYKRGGYHRISLNPRDRYGRFSKRGLLPWRFSGRKRLPKRDKHGQFSRPKPRGFLSRLLLGG